MQLEDGVTRQDFFLFFDEKQEENVKEKLAAKRKEKAVYTKSRSIHHSGGLVQKKLKN